MMRNRTVIPLALATFSVLALAGSTQRSTAQQPAGSQPATLKIQAREVVLPVTVRDKKGALVTTLKMGDFTLTEDGRPQTIKSFSRESNLPFRVGLLVDTSRSVSTAMESERKAAGKFVDLMLPADPKSTPARGGPSQADQAFLIHFDREVELLEDFTNSRDKLHHELDDMGATRAEQNTSQGPETSGDDRGSGSGQTRSHGGTQLYDAIYLGSEGLGNKDGRRVLVLVSDGGDTAKSTTYKQALEAALRHEVMIYSIIDVPIEASAGRDLGGEHALITLAEQTGGKSYYVSEEGLDKAFAHVNSDLRTQYLIGYYPQHQEPGRVFHRVLVTVPRASTQDFNVRHKTGYYVNAAPAAN